MQVGQLAGREEADFVLGGEGAANFVLKLLHYARVAAKQVGYSGQLRRGRFRSGGDQKGGAVFDLLAAHALFVVVAENLQERIRSG